eukprot:105944-Chlamydomonas_euryale.AAC.1
MGVRGGCVCAQMCGVGVVGLVADRGGREGECFEWHRCGRGECFEWHRCGRGMCVEWHRRGRGGVFLVAQTWEGLLQPVAACCSLLQPVAVCRSLLQRGAACCSLCSSAAVLCCPKPSLPAHLRTSSTAAPPQPARAAVLCQPFVRGRLWACCCDGSGSGRCAAHTGR